MQDKEIYSSVRLAAINEAAAEFMKQCDMQPTPDAIDQLSLVFLPCLRIMCERGYDPNGGTWRKSGKLGILCDVRKKFERLWDRAWMRGRKHDDSALDLINFVGMYLRSDDSNWGEWGEPFSKLDTGRHT